MDDAGVRNPPENPIISLGYEGRDATDLIEQLRASGVAALVDVRLTPLSRKPGLSKKRLAAALEEAGIAYVHLPQLGTRGRTGHRSGPARRRATRSTDGSCSQATDDRR